MFRREGISLLIAELIGTFALTFVVLSVSKSPIGIPYFVAIAAGLTLAIIVLVLGRAPGVHINPAVTFSMWAVRKIGTLQGLLFIAAQFMGAAFAWRLYTYLVNTTVPSIATKEFDWRVFVAEMVGTAVFVLGVTAAVYKNYEGGKFAATIGGSLVLGIVIAASISNGVINPAVALGVQSWSKEYVVAPLVGGLIGANLYTLLFAGEQFAVKTSGLRLPGRAVFVSKIRPTTQVKNAASSTKSQKTKPNKKRSK
jgi:glycerol uptake facilitator-like aquaporin